MKIGSGEVLAFLVALATVASLVAAVEIYRTDYLVIYSVEGGVPSFSGIRQVYNSPEEYLGIALLNERCVLGDYPEVVFPGENLTLCIIVVNGRREPSMLMIRYRFVYGNSTMPDEERPSSAPVISTVYDAVDSWSNDSVRVIAMIPGNVSGGQRAALVFELWYLSDGSWVYSGRYASLAVEVREVPLP